SGKKWKPRAPFRKYPMEPAPGRAGTMADGQPTPVVRFIRKLAGEALADLPDEQLLERFVAGRDQAAFAELVGRHGPMVRGVCLRVLGDVHEADDAFQATFLVLVRKAGAVREPRLLGNWLYGVAYRTAVKARAGAARRRGRERQVAAMRPDEHPP